MGELYPRDEKQTKNPAETTGNRYKIEILMSRTQKLKGLVAASLRVKNIKRQSLIITTLAIFRVAKIPTLKTPKQLSLSNLQVALSVSS